MLVIEYKSKTFDLMHANR